MKNSKKIAFYTVLTTIIADVITTIIISMISNINFVDATFKLWNFIYNLFKSILLFKVPVWIILLFILIMLLFLWFVIYITDNQNKSNSWYNDYKTDIFKGVLYTWDYYKYLNEINITNFRPICECNGELTTVEKYKNTHYSNPKLFCPNCDKILFTPTNEELEQAKLFVHNKLKKKFDNYKNELTNRKKDDLKQ